MFLFIQKIGCIFAPLKATYLGSVAQWIEQLPSKQ
jgi:hypothetical protein